MSFNKEFAAVVLKNIADSNCFRDVTFIAGLDQKKLRIHRVVMAASSKFLEAILKDQNKNEFVVKDIDGPMLQMIIDYCYSGNINITAENVNAVMAAASCLKIDKLQKECELFRQSKLETEKMAKAFRSWLQTKTDSMNILIKALPVRIESIHVACYTHRADGDSIDIQVYDAMSNQWKQSRKLLINGSGYGVAVHGDKIFVMGGTGITSKSMWSYSLRTGLKTRLPDMPNGRANFKPVIIGKYIYVFCGSEDLDICGNPQNTCARFHIDCNYWEKREPIPLSFDAEYSSKFSAIEFDGKIFLHDYVSHGGRNSKFELCYTYDPDCNKWMQGSVGFADFNRRDVTLAKVNNELYAIDEIAGLHLYDAKKNTWQKIGTFRRHEKVMDSIEYRGELYAVFKAQKRTGVFFGKIDPKNCLVAPLSVLSTEESPHSLFIA